MGSTVSLTPANVNLIVGKLVLSSSGNETVTIWVNPTDFTSEATLNSSAVGSSSLTTNGTLTVATNSVIYPRMQGTATVFDEIRLATSLAAVTPSAAPQGATWDDPFDDWATAYNLTGGRDDDDDGDGVSNFREYALNGHPLQPGNSGTAELRIPQGTVEFVYDRRITEESYLTYRVETCTNLIEAVWTEEDVTEIATDPVNDDFERVTCQINPAGASGKFIRLVVE
jgi:hypothetical protein